MSKKDFKQGMVAGAKPFGDKLDQLANVSEKAVTDIKEGIDGVNTVVNCILDDLSIREKKDVYDLDTPSGISELDPTEKEYLLAVLFTVADQRGQLTDYQKFYLRTLKAYLGITNVQIGIDLVSIENIESVTFQKVILQTIMEFLYLEYHNHDYMDDFETLFDCFSVNKRGVKELQGAIDHMASLLGLEGIACHYSPLAEPNTSEEEEDEEISDEAESFASSSPADDTCIVLDFSADPNTALTSYVHKDSNPLYKTPHFCVVAPSGNISNVVFLNFPNLSADEVRFDRCHFENCGDIQIDNGHISNSTFQNINTLSFERTDVEHSKFSHLKCHFNADAVITAADCSVLRCVFSNIVCLNETYLFDTTGQVEISHCNFNDCYTDREDGSLFHFEKSYGSRWKKNTDYFDVDESTCTGLIASQVPFKMTVHDIFNLVGRGTIVTGTVAVGSLSLDETVVVIKADGSSFDATANGIEHNRKLVKTAHCGEEIGVLFGGLEKTTFDRGDIIVKYPYFGRMGRGEILSTNYAPKEDSASDKRNLLEIPIEKLDFSITSYNCLKRAGINRVKDLSEKTEIDLRSIKNIGAKTIEEVIVKLANLGINLKT